MATNHNSIINMNRPPVKDFPDWRSIFASISDKFADSFV